MKLSFFMDELRRLERQAWHGCGSCDCVIEKPKEECTHSECRCRPKDFANQLRGLAVLLEHGNLCEYEWDPETEETKMDKSKRGPMTDYPSILGLENPSEEKAEKLRAVFAKMRDEVKRNKEEGNGIVHL